jgi:hypothetical protein
VYVLPWKGKNGAKDEPAGQGNVKAVAGFGFFTKLSEKAPLQAGTFFVPVSLHQRN